MTNEVTKAEDAVINVEENTLEEVLGCATLFDGAAVAPLTEVDAELLASSDCGNESADGQWLADALLERVFS